MNRGELERHLRANGCEFLKHGKRHDHWVNPATGVVVSIPRRRAVKRPTARAVCRSLGVPMPPGG
jgi:mRNA interferase HicA